MALNNVLDATDQTHTDRNLVAALNYVATELQQKHPNLVLDHYYGEHYLSEVSPSEPPKDKLFYFKTKKIILLADSDDPETIFYNVTIPREFLDDIVTAVNNYSGQKIGLKASGRCLVYYSDRLKLNTALLRDKLLGKTK